MSATALGIVVCQVLVNGVVHEADEGAAAHLWQLLKAGQLPLIAWFLVLQVPNGLRKAAPVLAAQVGAILLAAAPVALLGL
jgi:hypothetical protein